MKIPFIDLKKQYHSLEIHIKERINRVLEHGNYILGPEVEELENKLSSFTNSKHCITVSSGTEALLISLMALDIKPGDEVITTPFTYASTAESIALLGALPVFVDIEPNTCNINYNLIESKISHKTKAIMPVSLYGQPADMDEINMIARSNGNIPVIEDAAQSFGSDYKGRKSCNLSTIGCTSFFPSKPLGCYGDGGAIFTNDNHLAELCKQIRVHGQTKRYVHMRIGVGGRMDTIQCAIVLAKLERFDWEIQQRKKIGKTYNTLIDEIGLRRVKQISDRTSVFAQYTIFSPKRDELKDFLLKEGFPTAVHYPLPLNQQPAYVEVSPPSSTPIAMQASKNVLSLPMSPYLDKASQFEIIDALSKYKNI